MSEEQHDFLLDRESPDFEDALSIALSSFGRTIKAYENAAEKLAKPTVQDENNR